MKKVPGGKHEPRNHYDFRGGVRGKYAARYAEGTNIVALDPDVAKMFPDRQSVNEALRAVGQVVELRERRKTRSNKRVAPQRGHGAVRAKPASSRSNRGR